MTYKPDQRSVLLRAVTTAGVIEGTLHVAKTHLLLDAVNSGHDFLTLTDAHVRDAPKRVPFFALRRSETLLFVVPDDEAVDPPVNAVDHELMFLTPVGAVAGILSVARDVRVSDYLSRHEGFLALTQCRPWLEALGLPDTTFSRAFINSARIVGVTE